MPPAWRRRPCRPAGTSARRGTSRGRPRFPGWRIRARSCGAIASTSRPPWLRAGGPEVKTGDVQKSGIDSATDTGPHTWRLIAVDRASGKIVWDRAVHQGTPRMKRHVKASHASATPATDGRSIVALLGSEGLFCFDMEGKQKWRVDLGVMDVGLVDDPSYQWGPASSPVIFEDRVIVQNDRHKDAFLAAYDLATGKELLARRARRISVVGDAGHRADGRAHGDRHQRRQAHSRLRRRLRTRALAPVRQQHPGEGADAGRGRRSGDRDRRLSRRRASDLRHQAGWFGHALEGRARVADRARIAVYGHAARARRHPLRRAPTTAS